MNLVSGPGSRCSTNCAAKIPPSDPSSRQRQELAAPTADVEHRSRGAEVVDVRVLAIADQLPRAAHAALEGEVVEGLRRRLADRTGRRGLRARRSCGPPLDAYEPVVVLGQPRRQAGGGRPRLGLALLDNLCDLVEPRAGLLADGLDALRERVGKRIGKRIGEREHARVEGALVRSDRLDVPAHHLSQDPLGRDQDVATDPPYEARLVEERPVGGDPGQTLGLGPCGEPW